LSARSSGASAGFLHRPRWWPVLGGRVLHFGSLGGLPPGLSGASASCRHHWHSGTSRRGHMVGRAVRLRFAELHLERGPLGSRARPVLIATVGDTMVWLRRIARTWPNPASIALGKIESRCKWWWTPTDVLSWMATQGRRSQHVPSFGRDSPRASHPKRC
jgi:hypothetical protein